MNIRWIILLPILAWGLVSSPSAGAQDSAQGTFQPEVPKTWVDSEMEELELPLVEPEFSPVHVSSEYYYRLKIRPTYQSYPAYMPRSRAPELYRIATREGAKDHLRRFLAEDQKTLGGCGREDLRRTNGVYTLLAGRARISLFSVARSDGPAGPC